MTTYQTLQYRTQGPVAIILLDRPQTLNAFNARLRVELLQAFTAVEQDAAIRAVVLGSTGKAFSSGADLVEGLGDRPTVEEQIMEEYAPTLAKIATLQKPVIAAVPGVMAGIGAAFAMNCDLVVMADTGSLLLAFTNVALVPDGGITWMLLRHLGYQRAFQLIAEGGRYSAHECLDAGIANKLAPAEQVLDTAIRWAQELSQRAPIALGEAKKLLRAAANLNYAETVALEAKTQNTCITSEDAREAVTAFFEKRKAVFRGA